MNGTTNQKVARNNRKRTNEEYLGDEGTDTSSRKRVNGKRRKDLDGRPRTQHSTQQEGETQEGERDVLVEGEGEEQLTILGDSTGGTRLGIIHKVELIDFMCHSHLLVEFGERMNFVNGENGSGKSAILTAITVALGGKASITNRSGNMQGFVKANSPKAIIKLWIYNEGNEGYKQAEYGEMILIERIITNRENTGDNGNSGGSTNQLKIKNARTGAVVSTKKRELVSITDHMMIQVENPINILSQDASREFLSSNKPDELYKWFLRGTHLQGIKEDFECVHESIKVIEEGIKMKEEEILELRDKKREWEQKYKAITQVQKIVEEIDAKTKLIEKVKYRDKQVQKKEYEGKKQEVMQRLERFKSKIQIEENKNAELEAKISERQKEIQEKMAAKRQEVEKKSRVDEQLSTVISQLKGMKRVEEEMNRDAKEHRSRIEKLKADIEVARERSKNGGENNGEKEGQLGMQKAKLMKERQEVEEKLAEERVRRQEVEQARTELVARGREVKEQHENSGRELNQLERELERLKQQQVRGDRLVGFGRGVDRVIADIEEYGRWEGNKPIGPLGRYVSLRDKKWGPVVETVLDKALNQFMVETFRDRDALDQIMKRHNCASGIVVKRDEVFDYTIGEPDRNYLTILRVLNIQDDRVKRQLVDMNRIEQVLLVERRAEADDVMRSNNGRYPRNTVACFTVDGFQVGSKSGGFSTFATNMIRPTGRLGEDINKIVAKMETLVASKRDLHAKLTTELHQLRTTANDHTQTLNSLQTSHRALVRRIDALDEQQRVLELREEELSNMTTSAASIILANEAELRDVEQQLEMVKRQFGEQYDVKAELENSLRRLKQQQSASQQAIDNLSSAIDAASVEVENQFMTGRQHTAENIEYWNKKIARRTLDLQAIDQEISRLDNELAAAPADTADVPADLTYDQLVQHIQALSKTVKDIESAQTEPLEHIAAQTQHHIDAYARAKQTIRQMLNVSRILKDAHLIRLSRLSELKNAITKRVMFQFSLNLYRRGYGGLLHIDHQRQLLTPKVHTDADLALLSSSNANTNGISNPSSTSTPSSTNNSASTSNTSTLVNTRKDTRSLSGGEKSFTTISLLLALWDSTSCPIRALDEFDVFMDAANRSASMKMIVDSARCSPDSQYILITPQDLWVKPAADIKILVLDPPSR